MNLFLGGRPGVGKTTLLRQVARRLAGRRLGGFFTQEMRSGKERVGFCVETWSGQAGVLAHVDFAAGPRVGRYRVDVDAFERIGVAALEAALEQAEFLLVDEIGKMELLSNRFREAILRALDAPQPLVATVLSKPHPFADALKRRPDVELLEVTPGNRAELVDRVVERILASPPGRKG